MFAAIVFQHLTMPIRPPLPNHHPDDDIGDEKKVLRLDFGMNCAHHRSERRTGHDGVLGAEYEDHQYSEQWQ